MLINIETFKLYQGDFHCRQIFLGCSHDNGYARILEDSATDDVYVQRVTLLEGVPFEKELLGLPFKSKKFPEIFRNTKLSEWSSHSSPQTSGTAKSYNIYGGLPSRFPPPPSRHISSPDGYLQVSTFRPKPRSTSPRALYFPSLIT
jgi:hypothetical protein